MLAQLTFYFLSFGPPTKKFAHPWTTQSTALNSLEIKVLT
jgi:hypothetical protein